MSRQKLRIFRSKDRDQNLDEQLIIKLCLEGDTRAFEKIVEKHRDRIFSIAYHILLDSEDARDVVQQTFLKVWKSLPDYDSTRSFNGWVSKIAANCSIDFLRARKSSEPLKEIAIERFPLERNMDIRKLFLRIAPLLATRQRLVLILREVNGMEIPEIAEALDCTESTVRNLLSQAKDTFRRKIKELFPEYGM
jgi:RNA polymerase sigma-70 factor (ECF subfamily)